MKFPVRPELPTAALRSSQATHAAVDNSAPSAIRPESTYKSGNAVQTTGATSLHPAYGAHRYRCCPRFHRMDAQSLAFALLAAALVCSGVDAKTIRSPSARAEFQRQQPCPENGATKGTCPGYVVDHVIPLCAGGTDAPSNMQWQTVQDAKAKDKLEWEQCRKQRGGG